MAESRSLPDAAPGMAITPDRLGGRLDSSFDMPAKPIVAPRPIRCTGGRFGIAIYDETHPGQESLRNMDMIDPFGRKQDVSSFTLDQIRYWVQTILTFPSEAPIVIKEVPCVKAGCPPVETAIMVFLKNEPPRTFKILARINEVTFDHVYNLIENPLPCC